MYFLEDLDDEEYEIAIKVRRDLLFGTLKFFQQAESEQFLVKIQIDILGKLIQH